MCLQAAWTDQNLVLKSDWIDRTGFNFLKVVFYKVYFIQYLIIHPFFYLNFLSQTLTIHMTKREGRRPFLLHPLINSGTLVAFIHLKCKHRIFNLSALPGCYLIELIIDHDFRHGIFQMVLSNLIIPSNHVHINVDIYSL